MGRQVRQAADAAGKNDMDKGTALSVEDAIIRMKAEILAYDWRINRRRVDLLLAATSALGGRFDDNKVQRSLLKMIVSVLGYIKKREKTYLPSSLDFLKETMAHFIRIYEDTACGPAEQKIIFKTAYTRFINLKRKVQKQIQAEKISRATK